MKILLAALTASAVVLLMFDAPTGPTIAWVVVAAPIVALSLIHLHYDDLDPW